MTATIELDVNNAGQPFIGVSEFDASGYGIRGYVLSHGGDHTHPRIMRSRHNDLRRLIGEGRGVEFVITEAFEQVEAAAPAVLPAPGDD